MEIQLSAIEVRIIGVLIEKEITTPDYYPLSLNALVNACNQKSNRHPVMKLEESSLIRQLEELKEKGLVREVHPATGRVYKYKHNFSSIREFTKQEISLFCELFLRGPQTFGELRTHTSRLCGFETLEAIETVMQQLMETHDGGPYIQKLPREMGRRENRYAHLFSGEVDLEQLQTPESPAVIEVQAENKRIEALELEITTLKEEVVTLRDQFQEFRKQFE